MTLSPRTFACAALLALLPAAAHAADTPAVAVVREFLADRAAGKYAEAYALLSSTSRKGTSEARFAAGSPLPPVALKHRADPLFGLALLLGDMHNAQKYVFTVIGPDPAHPGVVLVRAAPPASAAGAPALTLHLATVAGPAAHAPRLDLVESLKATSPQLVAEVAESAKRAESHNNLVLLGLAVTQYAQDHDERLPDAAHWVDQIMPYVKAAGPFHDPSAPAGQAYSYAYNRALSRQSFALLEDQAHTVMLFESAKGVKNASDTGQSVPKPGRHKGGTDYLFADGHVKWLPDGTKPSFHLSGK